VNAAQEGTVTAMVSRHAIAHRSITQIPELSYHKAFVELQAPALRMRGQRYFDVNLTIVEIDEAFSIGICVLKVDFSRIDIVLPG